MRDGPLASLSDLLLGSHGSASLRERLVAGVAGLLTLRVAFGGLAFLLALTLARTLGTEGVGTYSYALAWVTLLGAPAILGMDLLIVRELAGFQLRSEWGLMRGMLRTANGVVLFTSLGLVSVVVPTSWMLRTRTSPEALTTLWVALPLVPLIAMTRVRQATLQGLHRVVMGSVPERLILPATLLALLFAFRVGRVPLSATVAMTLNVGATILAFAVGAWMLHRHFPAAARAATPVFQVERWIRGGLPVLLLNSVGVVFSQADTLIVGALKGSAAVGLYSVADKSADLLTFVLIAQSAAFASTAASLHAQKDIATLQRLTTRIARLTLLTAAPLGVLLIGAGHGFLALFYGAEFVPAQRALVFLSIGQLVNVAAGLNGMLLIMTDQAGAAVRVVAASAALNVGLNLLLVPTWGIEGGAVANMISLIAWNVLATWALHAKTGIHSSVLGVLRPRG